jgi:hypothetical protein
MNVNDLINSADDLKKYRYEHYLHPEKWNSIKDLPLYNWQSVQFLKENIDLIPEKKGIYSFVINPNAINHPQKYLGYLGKTDRTLRERFKEYLAEAENPKGRPKVISLLNRWKDNLDFCFIELDGVDIRVIESRLNDAFLPPFNTDFSPEINKIINAF